MRALPPISAALALALASCAPHRADPRALEDLARGGMVEVRGGTFLLGQRTGPAQDQVTYERVGAFLLDVTEVTVAAYARCVQAGACAPAGASANTSGIDGAERQRLSGACNRDRTDRAEHPVNCVDWPQATRYCAWVGKRLPSEAEWEWAARNAGADTAYPWGNEAPAAQPCWSGRGNDAGEARGGTCPAGSHSADATRAGAKDLGGDVWEWTSSSQMLGADSRGRDGNPGRVARGGAWSDEKPGDLWVSRRFADLPSLRDSRLGFRCASDR